MLDQTVSHRSGKLLPFPGIAKPNALIPLVARVSREEQEARWCSLRPSPPETSGVVQRLSSGRKRMFWVDAWNLKLEQRMVFFELVQGADWTIPVIHALGVEATHILNDVGAPGSQSDALEARWLFGGRDCVSLCVARGRWRVQFDSLHVSALSAETHAFLQSLPESMDSSSLSRIQAQRSERARLAACARRGRLIAANPELAAIVDHWIAAQSGGAQ